MKNFLMTAALLCLATPAHADAQKWQMLPEESKIAVHGKQMGKDFSGHFLRFNADITFDPAHLDQSHVTATIDTDSFQSGDQERDDAAKKSDWFDVMRFPNAAFTSTSFTKTDDTHFTAIGNLTIQGITADMNLPFELKIIPSVDGHEKAVMTSQVVIDRMMFELGTGEWADASLIDHAVQVDLLITASH